MIEEKKHYYNINKQLREHYFYKDGKLHGEYKSYYESGQIEIHMFQKDGKLHGEYKWFFTNGKLHHHEIYIDNKPLYTDPATLSNEGKLVLKLKHNIEFIDD